MATRFIIKFKYMIPLEKDIFVDSSQIVSKNIVMDVTEAAI